MAENTGAAAPAETPKPKAAAKKVAAHVLDGVENSSVGPDEARVYNTETGRMKVVGARATVEGLPRAWKVIQMHGDKPEKVLQRIAKFKK